MTDLVVEQAVRDRLFATVWCNVEAWITRMQDDREDSRMRRGVRRSNGTRDAVAEEE